MDNKYINKGSEVVYNWWCIKNVLDSAREERLRGNMFIELVVDYFSGVVEGLDFSEPPFTEMFEQYLAEFT